MCGTGRRSRNFRNGLKAYSTHKPFPSDSHAGKSKGAFCFNCQNENQEGAKYCERCGKEITLCPISQLPFSIGDSFAQCPMCGSVFHHHHLDIALSTSQFCPYCKGELDFILTGNVGEHHPKS